MAWKQPFSAVRSRRFPGLSMLAAALSASPAIASSTEGVTLGIEDQPAVVEVSAERLGEMRGRYVSGSEIRYFGVQMTIQWTTQGGVAVVGGLDVGFDFSESRPRVRISSIAPEGEANPADASAPQTTSWAGGDLSGVQGVGQLLQVTGDDNGVTNEIHLRIGAADGLDPSAGWNDGVASVTTEGGTVVETFADAGALGIQVDVPGQGTARQTLSGNGMHQMIRATGDLNQVTNMMNLGVEFSPVRGTDPIALRSTLETLRGLGHGNM